MTTQAHVCSSTPGMHAGAAFSVLRSQSARTCTGKDLLIFNPMVHVVHILLIDTIVQNKNILNISETEPTPELDKQTCSAQVQTAEHTPAPLDSNQSSVAIDTDHADVEQSSCDSGRFTYMYIGY